MEYIIFLYFFHHFFFTFSLQFYEAFMAKKWQRDGPAPTPASPGVRSPVFRGPPGSAKGMRQHGPVSYTHLDVYKRQSLTAAACNMDMAVNESRRHDPSRSVDHLAALIFRKGRYVQCTDTRVARRMAARGISLLLLSNCTL